jgi:hypothetical protein
MYIWLVTVECHVSVVAKWRKAITSESYVLPEVYDSKTSLLVMESVLYN